MLKSFKHFGINSNSKQTLMKRNIETSLNDTIAKHTLDKKEIKQEQA